MFLLGLAAAHVGCSHDLKTLDAAASSTSSSASQSSATSSSSAGGQGGEGGQGGAPPQNLSGSALWFDGGNDVASTQRLIANDFTLEAWIETTDSYLGNSFYEGAPVFFADLPGVADDFGATILNDRFCFGTGVPSLNTDISIESTSVVATGGWVHVAAVRKALTGEIKVLVNGVEEASMVTGNTAPLAAEPQLSLGANVVDRLYFRGRMDEIRIWNVARTADEIRGTMHWRLTGDELALVGYYRLDDGAGTVGVDSSLEDNDLALGDLVANTRPAWVPSDAPIFILSAR